MTTTPIARTGPGRMVQPRRTPRRVHLFEATVLVVVAALILDVIVLPSVPRALLLLVLGATVLGVAVVAQLRCWGTMIAPAFTPARLVSVASALAMALLLAGLPESVGAPWRWAVALLAPAVFYALSRWDDARTVDLLRERSAEERPPVGTVVP